MAKNAADLFHNVAFDARIEENPDSPIDYGNTVSAFREQFKRRAAFVYAGGSESVVAARLEGKGMIKVRLRSDEATRTIYSDWRMRDVRTGTTYAIRDVDRETDRRWVYLVVERGVAA